jgi:nucleotide-binding universal stress UspA family protein
MIFYNFMNSPQKESKFSRILVAIDGSSSSMKAAEFAVMMAEKGGPGMSDESGSELIALTALDVSTPRSFLSSFIAAPTYGLKELEEERNQAKQWMEKLRQKAEDKKIPFRSEIVEGVTSAGTAITDYAASHGISIIVVGTKGRSGVSKALLGSVALRVVTHSSCPVIVVK